MQIFSNQYIRWLANFYFLKGVTMRFHQENSADYSFAAIKTVRRVGNGISKVPVTVTLKG